jgi:hypothetical protein
MRKRRTPLIFFLLFVLASARVFSQSDDIIDSALSQDPLHFGEAAYLVLTAAGVLPETASAQTAAASSEASAWDFEDKAAETPVTYGEFSYMLMTLFDVEGGLMYRLFPGPRYAARELSYLRIAPYRVAPGKLINGAAALGMLSETMELKEKDS